MGFSGQEPTINRGACVITNHNFRNTTLISHKRKLIDILNSSGKIVLLLKLQAQGKERKWARRGWGPGRPRERLRKEKAWGAAREGRHAHTGWSSCQTGGRLAGSAIPPNCKGPGCSPRWGRRGGYFSSSWIRTSKPEGTPARKVMVHGRVSGPGGKWASQQKSPL